MKELQFIWKQIRQQIEDKRQEFLSNWQKSNEEILHFLIIGLCIPGNSIEEGYRGASQLKKNNYCNLNKTEIGSILDRCWVVHPYRKAKYIIKVLKKFENISIKQWITAKMKSGIFNCRNQIDKEIMGLNLVESSRFLRNIGFDIYCVIGRNTIKCLKRYDIIKSIGSYLSKKEYIETEQKLIKFGKEIGIPAFDLDFIFFYQIKNYFPIH